MPTSIRSETVRVAFASAAQPQRTTVSLGDRTVAINTPFASPADWRNH